MFDATKITKVFLTQGVVMAKYFLLFFFICAHSYFGYSAKFYIYNKRFSGNLTYKMKEVEPMLKNIRLRIVADDLYDVEKSAYLGTNRKAIEIAEMPNILTESNSATIYALKNPTQFFTLLAT